MQNTQEPLISKETGPMEGERIKHPCFGQIKAARVQGRSALYDSEFSHQNSITITISTSELLRSLSRNWHFEGDEIFKLEMSEAQWATFVSSVNAGAGVPCTLRRDHGKGVPGLSSPITDREKFKVEFDDRMNEAFARLEKLENLVADSKLSGKAREEIAKSLDDMPCGVWTVVALGQDDPGRCHVERQSKDRGEEKKVRKGREIQRPVCIHRHHQDQQ